MFRAYIHFVSPRSPCSDRSLRRLLPLGVRPAFLEERLVLTYLGDRQKGSPALDDLAPVAFEDDLLTRQKVVWTPTLPADPVGARELQVPVDHLAIRAGDVDVDAHVRIGPGNLGDDARQLDLLFGVVLRVESVVCERRHRRGGDAQDGDETSESCAHV